MHISCVVTHEQLSEVDRAGRPYTLNVTQYFEAGTGRLIMTRGRCVATARNPDVFAATADQPTALATVKNMENFKAKIEPVAARNSGRPFSTVLADIANEAEHYLADQRHAADHYGDSLNTWDLWCIWWQGAFAGLLRDQPKPMHVIVQRALAKLFRS